MANRQCPACHTPLQGNVSADGVCLSCGHDLATTAPPPNWHVANRDLRQIARRQRALLWIILGVILLQVSPLMAGHLSVVPWLRVIIVVGGLALELVALVFV